MTLNKARALIPADWGFRFRYEPWIADGRKDEDGENVVGCAAEVFLWKGQPKTPNYKFAVGCDDDLIVAILLAVAELKRKENAEVRYAV